MTDSYKVSHWKQFPEGTTFSSYYVESRGGKYDTMMVAGIKYLKKVLSQPITKEDVEEAKEFYDMHFGKDIFNYDGFMSIVKEWDGNIASVLTIAAIEEGKVVPVKTPIAVIEAGAGYEWLVGYFETLILRTLWYASTVATESFEAKKIIYKHMQETSDLTGDDFEFTLNTRLHDFGARGVSSGESAGIGGLSHLYNFIGSDTVEAIQLARELFDEDMAGISIPAREHSTTTSWENEDDAFENSIENFGDGVYACVMDSYDYEDALERIGTKFKDKIIAKGGLFVARPDSGNPVDVVMQALESLGKNFGFDYNSKGFKVLHPSVRVIQGDGVDTQEIARILSYMKTRGWAAENVAFGMGGGLLQHMDRDTLKFAMKCSYIEVDHVGRDVFKAPKTDPSKASKKGRLDVTIEDDKIKTILFDRNRVTGSLLGYSTANLTKIRENARNALDVESLVEQFV